MCEMKGLPLPGQIEYDTSDKSSEIGSGGFGTVYKGRLPAYKGAVRKWPDLDVAVKIAKRTVSSELEFQKTFQREADLWKTLNHPTINKFLCYWHVNKKGEVEYGIATILEWNSVFNCLHPKVKGIIPIITAPDGTVIEWNATRKAICAYGVALGLEYIHSKELVHADINSKNILLDFEMHPKIGDFGLSHRTTKEGNAGCGTICFQAPELLKGGCPTKETDVYAYGGFLFELLTGQVPFQKLLNDQTKKEDERKLEVADKVVSGEKPVLPKGYTYECPQLAEVMDRCFSYNPSDRPKMSDIAEQLQEVSFWEPQDQDQEWDVDEYDFNLYVQETKSMIEKTATASVK